MKIINECTSLKEVFCLWIEKQKCNNNTGVFVRDGYINKNEYDKSKKKILFILKESHLYDKNNIPRTDQKDVKIDSQQGFYNDFFIKEKNGEAVYEIKNNMVVPLLDANPYEPNKRNHFKVLDTKVKMKEKIARMAEFILNEKITSDYEELKKALSRVSYMNINKMGGGDSTNGNELEQYFDEYREYILKEIDILQPKTIVIMTNGTNIAEKLRKHYNNKIKIIDMVHTGIMPQFIKNTAEEIDFFNKYFSQKYNYEEILKEYKEGAENIFNDGDKGPYLKFNKSTLKYLIKFIYRYKQNMTN